MKEKNYVIIQRECMSCGNCIKVKINKKTKKIVSKHLYFGVHRFGVGDWCSHTILTDSKTLKFKRCIPIWKYIYLTLRDYKRTLLHQYEDWEMWECSKCIQTSKKRTKTLKKNKRVK